MTFLSQQSTKRSRNLYVVLKNKTLVYEIVSSFYLHFTQHPNLLRAGFVIFKSLISLIDLPFDGDLADCAAAAGEHFK